MNKKCNYLICIQENGNSSVYSGIIKNEDKIIFYLKNIKITFIIGITSLIFIVFNLRPVKKLIIDNINKFVLNY